MSPTQWHTVEVILPRYRSLRRILVRTLPRRYKAEGSYETSVLIQSYAVSCLGCPFRSCCLECSRKWRRVLKFKTPISDFKFSSTDMYFCSPFKFENKCNLSSKRIHIRNYRRVNLLYQCAKFPLESSAVRTVFMLIVSIEMHWQNWYQPRTRWDIYTVLDPLLVAAWRLWTASQNVGGNNSKTWERERKTDTDSRKGGWGGASPFSSGNQTVRLPRTFSFLFLFYCELWYCVPYKCFPLASQSTERSKKWRLSSHAMWRHVAP